MNKINIYKKKIIFIFALLTLCVLVVFSIAKLNRITQNLVTVGNQKDLTTTLPASMQLETSSLDQDEIFNSKTYKDKFVIWFFNIDEQGRQDIHSGDAMLLKTPDNVTMLIDAGLPESGKKILDYVRKLGITKLDYAVATHMHIDHIGGYGTILDNIPIDNMILSKYTDYNSENAKDLLSALQSKNIKMDYVKEGDKFSLGKDITFEVMNPEESDGIIPETDTSAFLNNQSIVMKIIYKNNSFLLAGDIQKGTEERLVNKYESQLDIDLLKIPHHGSTTSSSSEFISALSPKISVISFYALESMSIYERYKKEGSKVYLTGLDGIVQAVSDGNQISIITEKERKGSLKP